ncbi:LysR family transcriptional regulator [Ruminococcaceae bacterium OttesenSCG-928-D13]|nr:LysR family transcriptional regulator [Ruminococcaceae bacterium OttesenSCG-928-D13]
MNLNHVEYFIAAGRLGSMSKAAAELHVSQPAVSDAIKSLEKELGVRLFHRVKNRVHLTEEGEYYLERVARTVAEFKAVNDEMLSLGHHGGAVKIGVTPMVGTFMLPQIFTGFSAYSPGTELIVREGGSYELLNALMDESIDLAIVSTSEKSRAGFAAQISFRKLTSTEFMLCLPGGHPLAKRKSVPMRTLDGEPLILFEKGFLQNRMVNTAFQLCGIEPRVLLETSQLHTVVAFIKQGIAASFLFPEVADTLEGTARLSVNPPLTVDLELAWKPSRPTYRDARLFISFLSNYDNETEPEKPKEERHG